MTFDDIMRQWQACGTQEQRRALWEQWMGPGRGWFRACHTAVERRDTPALQAWLDPADSGKQTILRFHGAEAATMVQAHLLCAWAAVHHGHWPTQTVPDEALGQAVAETALARGFLRDLAQELLRGQLRQKARQQALTVLLVDPAMDTGVVATLRLELMPGGDRQLYPIPALAFVARDAAFCQAEHAASAYAQQVGLWPEGWDVRWQLERRDRHPIGTLTGPSLGGALALGLAKLLVAESKQPLSEWLHALELDRVTLTATLDASGCLGAVGGLGSKLLAAAKEAAVLGLLRVVIVSSDQLDVPPELLEPEAFPLRVMQAATLRQAVEKLHEEHGPRSAVRQHERKQCARLDVLGTCDAPIESHYQALPLLHEVKRERLRRDGLTADILGWEEKIRGENVTYERYTLEEIFSSFGRIVKEVQGDVPRFVLLGPPGSGKTTLAQYLAWQAAGGDLCVSGRQLLPARVRLREWERWALKATEPNFSLVDYVAELYRQTGLSPAPTAEQWQRWLLRGEVLLLLDGLDEIGGYQPFLAALKTTLTTFEGCPTVLTCRTVSFAPHGVLCPDLPVFILDGFDEPRRDTYIRAFPPAHPDRFNPDRLIDQLNHTPQLRPLAANPLLLSIICYVVDDAQDVDLPATRAQLYDKVVERLLARPRRVEVTYPGGKSDVPLARKRRILEWAAFMLFAELGPQRRLTVEESRLLEALTAGAQAEALDKPADVADSLLLDLTHNSGLLRGDSSQGYFFLHLTVHEFLAAAALARRVNAETGKGWHAALRVGRITWTVRALVDKKAWDPRWQEVILLLAGQVQDPLSLLAWLSHPAGDDVFRHRLCLAARCLPELAPADYPALAARSQPNLHTLSHRIAREVLELWWLHRKALVRFAHIEQCFDLMAQSRPGTVLPEILQRLRAADPYTRKRAAEVLGRIGKVAAQEPTVLPALAACVLHDVDWDVRSQAAQVLGQLGVATAQHAEVISALVAALHDTASDVRAGAARLLSSLGASAAQEPAVLPALVAALRDVDQEVRREAVSALGAIEAAAQDPTVLPAIIECILRESYTDHSDFWRALPWAGAKLIREAAVQHPAILPMLLESILRDPNEDARMRAAWVVGWLGKVAARHPAVLPTLVAVLRGPSGAVRTQVVQELPMLGAAAAQHPEVLAALVTLLHDTDRDTRCAAAAALGQLGAVAAQQPEVISTLVGVLRDMDWDTHRALVEALGQRGKGVAQYPEVISALVATLRDADWDTRFEVAEASERRQEGAGQLPAEFLALVADLCHVDRDVRLEAAEMLGEDVAQDPGLLPWLMVALGELLRRMGETAAQHPEGLSALVADLCDVDGDVRLRAVHMVAEVLGRLLGAETAQYSARLSSLVEELRLTATWEGRFEIACVLRAINDRAVQHPAVRAACVAGLRARTAQALGQLGEAAVQHPAVLPTLLAALRDADGFIRSAAAGALAEMGEVAAQHPAVLSTLVTVLRDARREVLRKVGREVCCTLVATMRSSMRAVVGNQVKAVRRHPRVLPTLVRSWAEQARWVRRRVATTLGKMGEAAVRHPRVLRALMAALHDRDCALEIAMSLEDRMAEGMRIFKGRGWKYKVRNVQALSE